MADADVRNPRADSLPDLARRVKRIEKHLGIGPVPPDVEPPPPPPPPPSGDVVNANNGVPFRIGDERDQTIDLGGKTYENAKVGIVIENGEMSERMTIGNGRILNPESNGCYLYDIRDSTVSNLILEGSRDERPLRVPNADNVVFDHIQCLGKNDKSAAWFLGSTEIRDVTVRHSLFTGGEVRFGIRQDNPSTPQVEGEEHLGDGKVTMVVEDSTFERTRGNATACLHMWGESHVTYRRCTLKTNGWRILDIEGGCHADFENCQVDDDGDLRLMVEADKARMKGAVGKVEIA